MYINKYNQFKLLSLFTSDYSARFYLRQISSLSGLSLKNTQDILAELEKNHILKSQIDGKNKYFSVNFDNPSAKLQIIQTEVYKTINFFDKYPLLKPFMKSVNSDTPIIVFGSFARLQADKNSDIDLLIVSAQKNKLLLAIIPYEVHEIYISERNLDSSVKSGEALIKEIQKHHVVLNNHSFYVSMMWKNARH
jgi:predicted nucleotidyltransferase